METFGLQFEHSEGKKSHGMVIKWFHLVGTTIEDEKDPCKLIIHHARRQTFSSSGFQDSDPIPEDTADAKRLSILKYPKLAFDQIIITFTEEKIAKKVHKLILKQLRALGQGMPLSACFSQTILFSMTWYCFWPNEAKKQNVFFFKPSNLTHAHLN